MRAYLLLLLLFVSPAFAEVYEVSGRVSGPDDEPVHWTSLRFRIGDGAPFIAGSTELDGSFTVRVEEGTYMMDVDAEGYAAGFVDPIVVQGGPVHGVELRLERDIVLQGRFVLPPGDGRLMVMAVQTPMMASIELASDGSFRVPLGPGEWEIRAYLPTLQARTSLKAQARVSLERGQTPPPFEMTLPWGEESLDGRFVETYSNQWGLRLLHDLPDGVSLEAELHALDGRFRFKGLPAGFYTLQVYQIECDLADQRVIHEQSVLVPSPQPVAVRMEGGPLRIEAQ